MSNNPYLLHGDELARTEAARKTGATPKPRAGEALNPKAAWPFPKTRAELEAEIITLVEALQNLVEAVNGNYIHDSLPKKRAECWGQAGFLGWAFLALVAVVQCIGFLVISSKEAKIDWVIVATNPNMTQHSRVIGINDMASKNQIKRAWDWPLRTAGWHHIRDEMRAGGQVQFPDFIQVVPKWRRATERAASFALKAHVKGAVCNSERRIADIGEGAMSHDLHPIIFSDRNSVSHDQFRAMGGHKFLSHFTDSFLQFHGLISKNSRMEKKGAELKPGEYCQNPSPPNKVGIRLLFVLAFLFAGLSIFLIAISGLYGNDKGPRINSYLLFAGLLCAALTFFLGGSFLL